MARLLFYGAPLNRSTTTAPTSTDDAGDGFSVGSIWTNTNTGEDYVCTSAAVGAATWSIIGTAKSNSAASSPAVGDDVADGYSVGSLWTNTSTSVVYVCTSATLGAAVWSIVGTAKSNSVASSPGVGDDVADGYSAGSIWTNTATGVVYVCTSAAAGAAVWSIVGTAKSNSTAGAPGVGDDTADGYSVGSRWTDTSTSFTWVCTSAAAGAAVWKREVSAADAPQAWLQLRVAARVNAGLGVAPDADPESEYSLLTETAAGWAMTVNNLNTGGSGQDSFLYDMGPIHTLLSGFVNDGSWGVEFRLTPVDATPGTTAKIYCGVGVCEDLVGGLNSGFLGISLGDNGSDAWAMRAQRYGNTSVLACPSGAGGRTIRGVWWPGGDPTAGTGANFGHITGGSEAPSGSVDCMVEYVGAGTNITSYKLVVYGGSATATNDGPHSLGAVKIEVRPINLRVT